MQPLIPYFQSIQFRIPLPDFMPQDELVLHSFGLLAGFGFLYGAEKTKKHLSLMGMPPKIYTQLFIAGILAIVIGGPLGNGLFYHPDDFFNQPIHYLSLSSGFSSLGVFVFAAFALALILGGQKQPLLPYADAVSIGFASAWLFTRIGCTLNHEHPGSSSDFFLARYCRPVEGWTIEWPQWMHYSYTDLRFNSCLESGNIVRHYSDTVSTNYAGILANHDTGLYEALYALILVIVFYFCKKKPRFTGFYALVLALSYLPLRFGLDFLRPLEHNPRFAGLTPAQWACMILLSALICFLLYQWRKKNLQKIG